MSVFTYGFELLTTSEFSGRVFTCETSQLKNGVCPVTNGQQVLQNLGIGNPQIALDWSLLVGISIAVQTLGFFALYFRAARYRKTGKL